MSVKVKIKAFGIAREIMGGREIWIETQCTNVGDLRRELLVKYPALKGLNSLMIALNAAYAEDSQTFSGADEIAVIPPVSGG